MNGRHPEKRKRQRRGPHILFWPGPAFAILFLLTAGQGWAHGVRGVLAGIQAVCILSEYDDGEPMSYARVEIMAPGSQLPFQSGRTDRNGRFCFRPDISGDWRITVSDAMGHRLRLSNTINDNMIPAAGDGTGLNRGGPWTRMLRIADGLAIIFGFAGILAWLQSRKKIARNRLDRSTDW